MTAPRDASDSAAAHALEARLRRVGDQRDGQIDLGETGLLLAAYRRPDLDFERYRHHLSLLARDAADMGRRAGGAESLAARADVLRAVLAERYGYAGDRDTYDDLQNADLARVIDRRKGLPVALGLLYIHTAQQQGWDAAGTNFPGHFLIRLQLGEEVAILDPFSGGEERSSSDLRALLQAYGGGAGEPTAQHCAPVGRRELLLRLQNNIKLRLLADGRTGEGLQVVETMLMLAPEKGPLWCEAGALHGELGNLRAAIASLQTALQLGLAPEEAVQAAELLRQLRVSLH